LWRASGNRQATSYTGYLSAALSLIALLLAVALLPETRTPGAPVVGRRRLIDFGAWRAALSNPAIAPVILIFFLATIGFGAFESTLALLVRDTLGLVKRQSYWVFTFVGFTLIIAQGFLYRRLAKKLGEVTFIALGIAFMAVGVLALAGVSLLAYSEVANWNTRLAVLLLSLPAAVVGFAFLTPSAQALVSRRTDQEHQGEILGVNQSAASLARIIAPIFGLTLYKQTDSHMLPYILGAGLLLLMLPLIPRLRKG
jgi:DHA1 family tetracycline resistance protein-like MFS transporter